MYIYKFGTSKIEETAEVMNASGLTLERLHLNATRSVKIPHETCALESFFLSFAVMLARLYHDDDGHLLYTASAINLYYRLTVFFLSEEMF